MYVKNFGLQELPFSTDTSYFYRERSTRRLRICRALEHGEGFVKLVGEGHGENAPCRRLLARLAYRPLHTEPHA